MKLLFKLAVLCAVAAPLPAWLAPIKVPTTGVVRESSVRLDHGNTAYIAYIEDFKLKLVKYDGQRLTFVAQVSDGARQAYTPFMRFDQDNTLHIIWGEAVTLASADNSVMYRTYTPLGGT